MASSDWVDLGSETINFNASLEKASGLSIFAKDPESAKKNTSPSDEYLLTLDAVVNMDSLPWMKKVQDEKVEFMIVLDMSGSMAGTPWRQVQSAAVKMLDNAEKNKKVSVKLMVYNDNAIFVQMNNSTAVTCHEIKQLRAGGSTNFVDVFHKIGDLLNQRIEGTNTNNTAVTSESNEKKKMFVIFMTDGCDTCNPPAVIMAEKEKLQDTMRKYGEEIIVHVLGFSEHYNDAFLRDLSLMGTSDGTYNYVNPKDEDGNQNLEETLTKLVEATTGLVGKSVYLLLKMKSPHGSFLGNWFGVEEKEIVIQAFMSVDKNMAKLVTSKFVRLPPGDILKLDIELVRDLLSKSNTTTPCSLKNVKVNRDYSKVATFRKHRTFLNILTARLGDAIDESTFQSTNEEGEKWQQLIKKSMQDQGQVTPADGKDINELADAIKHGLNLCEKILHKDASESEDTYHKRVRTVETAYNISTNQMHNVRQFKSKEAPRKDRSDLQYKSAQLD